MASPTAPLPPPAGALHDLAREGALPALPCSNAAAASFRRFKVGVSRPPPGPRRTPDHPPYAEMIQMALRAPAEDGGSTVDAISRRIAAVYLDLPWAHERLLPHYLGRLVAAGDVAVAAPGRYALLSPSSAASEDAQKCDRKCMELDRNVESSWALGDGTGSAGGEVLSNRVAAPRLKVILRPPRKPECSKPAEDSSTPDLSLLAEQVAAHVPKRPRTPIYHKPRRISGTIFEGRVSNQLLVLSSEQLACALPANVGDFSPNQIIACRPQIEGWVQVLLAVQPTTKAKKSRQCCNKMKMVNPIVQFQPDNLLLSREAEDAGQMDARLQTSLTKQSDIDGLLEGMVDENREEIERCIQLMSALNLDPNGSSQTTKAENLKHAGGDDEPMSNAPFHVYGYVPILQEKGPIHGNSLHPQEIEKRPQDEESTQIIPMDEHPAEDELQRKDHVELHVDEHLQVPPQMQHKPGDDLQMDEGSGAHSEELVLLLPLEKSMVSDFVQMSESEENTETKESIEDASSKLSKPDDPLQTEETFGLHNDGLLQGPAIGSYGCERRQRTC